MTPGAAVLALVTVSAFSAMPAAFYASIEAATGTPWSTALLFSCHALAALTGMMLVAALPLAPAALVSLGLGGDAAGAVLLMAGSPGELPALLAGRIVCGLALGIVTAAATTIILAGPHGSPTATAGLFGGIGGGAVVAGVLAGAGLPQAGVFALGGGVLLVALAVAGVRRRSEARGRGPGAASAPLFPVLLAGVVVAAAANAALGLLTSIGPAMLAADAGPLAAGALAGVTMLCAGFGRIVLSRVGPTARLVIGLTAATCGTAGLLGSSAALPWLAVAGAAMVGAAAGLGYDAALRATGANRRAIVAVQAGGQSGLILPPLLVTAGAAG